MSGHLPGQGGRSKRATTTKATPHPDTNEPHRCSSCGSDDIEVLGTEGHFRCRHCGVESVET